MKAAKSFGNNFDINLIELLQDTALCAYRHDIFISYKRQSDWDGWVKHQFCRQLRAYLQEDLGIAPRIFIDEQMGAGRDLPHDLGENLAYSKVFIPLFSGDYFYSQWCIHELDLALDRNREFTTGNSGVQHLIVPIIVHDGKLVPECVRPILYGDFSKYRVLTIAPNSPLEQAFSEAVKLLSPMVQGAIEAAPAFDSKWVTHHRNRFSDLQIRGATMVKTSNFTIPTRVAQSVPLPKLD